MDKQDLVHLLLQLGDSAMIHGQRLCEWCGKAPALEEELALMNVGLDLVGQARNWYEYAADLLDDGRDADSLAFLRTEREYQNLLLLEQPNGDYAVTLTKQFLYDAWHHATLEGLTSSSDLRVAGIAAKGLKEVTYHLTRSSEWIERFGDGTEESYHRVTEAVNKLWRFTFELVGTDDVDRRLMESGVGPNTAVRAQAWLARVGKVFERANLNVPPAASHFYLSGRKGLHTEHLGLLLAEMQYLQRAYPDATW